MEDQKKIHISITESQRVVYILNLFEKIRSSAQKGLSVYCLDESRLLKHLEKQRDHIKLYISEIDTEINTIKNS